MHYLKHAYVVTIIYYVHTTADFNELLAITLYTSSLKPLVEQWLQTPLQDICENISDKHAIVHSFGVTDVGTWKWFFVGQGKPIAIVVEVIFFFFVGQGGWGTS